MRRAVLAAAAVVLSAGAAAVLPASPGLAGNGFWSQITSPAAPGSAYYPYKDSLATQSTTVSGKVSAALETYLADNSPGGVNIYCFYDNDTLVSGGQLNSAPVPVASDGSFAAVISTPTVSTCILRAVPAVGDFVTVTGDRASGSVGAFTGPTYYIGGQTTSDTAGHPTGFETVVANPAGAVVVTEAGLLGVGLLAPFDPFDTSFPGTVLPTAPDFALPAAKAEPAGDAPTASSIVVDGHNAYLPLENDALASSAAGLTSLSVSLHRSAATGVLTLTERAPLDWCAGNTYPPVDGACASTSTGVEFERTLTTLDAGAAYVLRDSFVSTDDKAHTVSVDYEVCVATDPNGDPGVQTPGAHSFTQPAVGTTLSLPLGVHTLLGRADVDATDGASDNTDYGYTYSGRPTRAVAEGPLGGSEGAGSLLMAFTYTRAVPKAGAAEFGFAGETGFGLAAVRALAAGLQSTLAGTLSITAPRAHQVTGRKTTVTGRVTADANGLPARVSVRSGTVAATAAVSASGTWSAVLTLATGRHTITATALDPAGNTLSASVSETVG